MTKSDNISMRKIFIYLHILLLSFILMACPNDSDAFFRVQNKSEKTVVVAVGYILPNTGLPSKDQLFVFKTLKPEKKRSISGFEFGDEGLRRMEKEKLSIFFIDKAVYDTQPWETIQKDYLILKRIDATWNDYIETDGSFTYP